MKTITEVIGKLIKDYRVLSDLLADAGTTEAKQYIKGCIKQCVETLAFIRGVSYIKQMEDLK